MSGTSCDGLDIALIEIEHSGRETEFVFLGGRRYAYKGKQKSALLHFMQNTNVSAKDFSQLNFYLSEIWAEMIKQFLSEMRLTADQIDLIGSHGQTIWHQPEPEEFIDLPTRSTLQLGDPSVLAQLCAIPVVGDFRTADMALGGQGAPLIPYFDWVYFSRFKKNILTVNLGGIANVTFISGDGAFNKLIAFDCGPANMLMDQAMAELFGKAYDKNGQTARQGRFSEALFRFLIDKDSFARQKPPKSTGREFYGSGFFNPLIRFARNRNLAKADIVTTLSRYTAFTVYENYRQFIFPQYAVQEVAVGGGGAHNGFIMETLQDYFKDVPVQKVGRLGLNEDFKEAIGFALLANESWHGHFSNVPQITGAGRPAVLGKICLV